MTAADKILRAMPATLPQLIEATGYRRNTLKSYLSRMKKSSKAHVGAWVKHESGQPLAVYSAGQGVDAIKSGSRRAAVVPETAVSYALRSQPALAGVGLETQRECMNDDTRNLLSDLLKQWHRWASGYQHVGGISTSPMFRGAKPCKTREDDDAVDGAIHNSTCETINCQVMDMEPVHRTILQLHARNLHAGVSVWSSPRLPADPEERAIVLMEARNGLMKRLILCGVV